MTPTNASFLKPDSRIHALLIGPSGVGKTAAAASFPGYTVILDFDDRAKGAILGCDFLDEKRTKGEIEIIRILPYNGKIPQGIKEVYTVLESLDTRVSKKEIQNVIVDSTTSMKKYFLNESINNGIGVKHHSLAGVELGQKQDYNYATVCMQNVIYQNLKTFPCNLFISSHIKDKIVASPTTEDPDRTIVMGQTITAPGQLAIEMPTWFDEVWEFELDATIRSQTPRRYVMFQSMFGHTSFRLKDEKGNKKHRLEITDKSFYEVIKGYLIC